MPSAALVSTAALPGGPARRAPPPPPASCRSAPLRGGRSSFCGGSLSLVAVARARPASLSASVDRAPLSTVAATVPSGSTVLVIGATGGVGQLLTCKLLERGYKVKAMVRSVERAEEVLGKGIAGLEFVVGLDTRDRAGLLSSGVASGVDAVLCATGTTAFPSARWKGGNTPQAIDLMGTANLVAACEGAGVGRFVLCSSVGVERYDQMPYKILNAFGVLKYKAQGEQRLMDSGVPFTIIRPGRLTDGPYTSYDINTLTKATSGTRRKVELAKGDCLDGEASRIVVAEAMVQALDIQGTEGGVYCISSAEGAGPEADKGAWEKLFAAC